MTRGRGCRDGGSIGCCVHWLRHPRPDDVEDASGPSTRGCRGGDGDRAVLGRPGADAVGACPSGPQDDPASVLGVVHSDVVVVTIYRLHDTQAQAKKTEEGNKNGYCKGKEEIAHSALCGYK